MTMRLAICGLLLAASAAQAQITCSASASGAAFGPVDPLAAGSYDTTGTITVSCSGLVGLFVNYSVALGPGSGTTSNRTLTAGPHQLAYNLYTSPARTIVWGDGTGGSSVVSGGALLTIGGFTQQHTVYGRVSSGQTTTAAGAYADTIVITITY